LTVDDPAFSGAVRTALAGVPDDAVTRVVDRWSTGDPGMASADGRTTYAVLTLAGDDAEAREQVYTEQVADALVADGLVTLRGGVVPTGAAINVQVEEDIAAAESLSIPLLMVLLILVFGSLAAAGLPLLIGGFAILGAFAALKALTLVTDVSIFSVNLVIMLGLGLAIDYGLFMVARFREELSRQDSTEVALVRTLATAGRTVMVSGLTVALSLGALLLFPMNFLRSMGYGGIASVLVAMVAALTVLPAMLAVLGRKVDALKVPWLGRRRIAAASRHADEGAWASLARAVMRRPLLVTVVTAALLLALGAPFLRAAWGGVDARVLPPGTEARVASTELGEAFPGAAAAPITVVVQAGTTADVEAYLAELGDLPGAGGVQVTAQQAGAVVAAVDYSGESTGEAALALVDDVRAAEAPSGATVLVGGPSAALVDLLDGLGRMLPWAALYLVLVMFAVLFLAFGSVVLPIKAIAMNVLSLSATLGVLVWGFQDGRLADLLGFTATGTLEATQPILILALAFGLSMDYEVFLLSRVREEWDRTGDNERAVARGLQRTGGIITSAALLFVVVVGAFATSGIVFIQMIGIGLAVAVIIDATLVRALLVPATMRLLGRANWWAPAPMARFWQRYGLREGEAAPEASGSRASDATTIAALR
jgi:RND superfamily putative drug exporter